MVKLSAFARSRAERGLPALSFAPFVRSTPVQQGSDDPIVLMLLEMWPNAEIVAARDLTS